MPINPNIAMGYKPPEFDSPVNQLSQLMQMKQMQQANQLNQMKMDEYGRGVQETNRLNAVLSGQGFDIGNADHQRQVIAASPTKGVELIDKYTQGLERKSKADKEAFSVAKDRYGIYQTTLGALKDSPYLSKDMVVQAGQGLVDQGILTPDMYQRAVQNLPDDIAQLRLKLSDGLKAQMSPKDIFELFAPKTAWKNNGKVDTPYESNPLAPGYSAPKPVVMTTTPGEDLRSSDAAKGRAQSMTIANMADSRARDANTIKAGEKKATEDLTKGSQLASFDTMLGTLDRLSAHPGLSKTVGLRSVLPTIPGGDSANFQAELNTFQSQAFIPMVAQLKGMGALSDAEGKKLTQAVGALDPKMGEKAFRESIDRIKSDMESAYSRVSGKPRKGGGATADWGNSSPKVVDFGSLK